MRTPDERPDHQHAVRNFVHHVLCELENLEPNHFPMSQRTLQRAGRPCGVLFVLHGPRQLQVSAVWETDRNVLWLYNAVGKRCQRISLPADQVAGGAVATAG